MSTWLTSFSLSNPFKSDSNSDAGDDHPEPSSANQDIFSKSSTSDLYRRLPGVASFFDSISLTMVTDDQNIDQRNTRIPSASDAFTGIKNDFAEIGGSIKALLSSSSNKAATGISLFTSHFLKFNDDEVITEEEDYEEDEEEDDDEPETIDEEVVDFARKVSLRPELWTEFPLAVDGDFEMSDNQKLHAANVEHLVPSLASLRQEISSGHLSSEKFWLIYFILLLPRLNEDDVKLLCGPQIIEAREKLLVKLQNNSNAARDGTSSNVEANVISKVGNEGKSSHNQTHSDSMEDVSFSDLENEEEDGGDLTDRLSGLRISESSRVSSASESNEWVRLREARGGGKAKADCSNVHGKDSESEESSGWFAVDGGDTEVDSLASG